MMKTPPLSRARILGAASTGAIVGVGLSALSFLNALLRRNTDTMMSALALLPHLAGTGAMFGVILLLLMKVARGRATCMLAGFIGSVPTALHMTFVLPGAYRRPGDLLVDATACLFVFGLLGAFFGYVAHALSTLPDPSTPESVDDDSS